MNERITRHHHPGVQLLKLLAIWFYFTTSARLFFLCMMMLLFCSEFSSWQKEKAFTRFIVCGGQLLCCDFVRRWPNFGLASCGDVRFVFFFVPNQNYLRLVQILITIFFSDKKRSISSLSQNKSDPKELVKGSAPSKWSG